MTTGDFGFSFVDALVSRCTARLPFEERTGAGGAPLLPLTAADNPGQPAGFLRLWAGGGCVDRMVHIRLAGDPADTQLFFLFGTATSVMPHFHGQVVQFGEDRCVYNADLLPRLDPIDHPAYIEAVFGPITKAYWRATQNADNACASAPANPAIAAYLSPWSIGVGRPTDRAELERVGEQIHVYLDHWLDLVKTLDYPPPEPAEMRERNRRHLEGFFSERLDPRAWKGVYRLVGTDQGQEMRRILMNNLSDI